MWAESLVHAQRGDGEARPAVDAAHALATETDARLEHAIAALARAKVLAAIGDDDAAAAAEDAQRQFASLDLTGAGWATAFDTALTNVRVR
jgi:hypothetical protein